MERMIFSNYADEEYRFEDAKFDITPNCSTTRN